jgi:rhamnose transport system permease protein
MISWRHIREISVALVYGMLLALLAWKNPNFFHRNQFRSTWISSSPLIVLSVGMTMVILARHIDISIGSQFSICAVVAGMLAKAGYSMPIVGLGTLAVGSAMGAINGILIALLNLPSIVVTLATMVILQQSLSLWRQGEAIVGLPPTFQWFGLEQASGQWTVLGIAVGVFVVFMIGMRMVPAGRAILAVGSDQEAARLAGVRPRRVVLVVFILMGTLTALAAMLRAVRQPTVVANSGLGLELEVIAAVVVGGTAISGGRGTLIGSLLGVALLSTITPALIFLTREPYWDQAIQGGIILLAVASDSFQPRPRRTP